MQEEAPSGELLEGAVSIPCSYCLNSYWVKRSERQALGEKPVTWGKIGSVFRTRGKNFWESHRFVSCGLPLPEGETQASFRPEEDVR